MQVSYQEGRGVLRQLLDACEQHSWQLTAMAGARPTQPGEAGAVMTLSGAGVLRATRVLAAIAGVTAVSQLEDDAE